ncbi:MAG: hypothetical protein ACREOW_03310 [Thermodesulfobacteriota bacterium]
MSLRLIGYNNDNNSKTEIMPFLLIVLTTVIALAQITISCSNNYNLSVKRTKYPKISTILLNEINRLETPTKEGVLSKSNSAIRMDEEGRIQIYIKLYEVDENKLEELRKNGLTIDIYDNKEKLVQGWALPKQIKMISELPYVKFIDLPTYGVSN